MLGLELLATMAEQLDGLGLADLLANEGGLGLGELVSKS
jgi:hypothetical protein